MPTYPELIKTVIPENTGSLVEWGDLVNTYNYFGPAGPWIFRGLSSCEHGLQTSLERAIFAIALSDKKPTPEQERQALRGTYDNGRTVLDLEGGLIRRFRRQCQHYVPRVPSRPLELLALMQHYSAPTRLQDWTYSFWVAVFLAIESATPQRGDRCAIWALDADWIRDRFRSRVPDLYALIDEDRNLEKHPDSFKLVFRQERLFVCPVSPYHLNDRLIIQQGVFLCPGAVRCRFEDNLADLQYDDVSGLRVPVLDAAKRLFRIDISTSPQTKKEILQQLSRMNISNATLFPGLQGFARSLEAALAFPHTLEYGDTYESDFVL